MGIISKKEEFCNGRLIVCNFKNLNKNDFILPDKALLFHNEVAAATKDGKIYINSRMDNYEFVKNVYEILINSTHSELFELKEMIKRKYPFVTAANIAETTDDPVERTQIFASICVPVELKRRELEKEYYGI